MSDTIVLLDLKNYSKLGKQGQEAVFEELLPKVRKLLDDSEDAIVDANTWGDAILVVFQSVPRAVKFALDVRHLVQSGNAWNNHELADIGARIAIHTADLKRGTDKLRTLATVKQHRYGIGLVIPARIEPIVEPNSIWVTAEAYALIHAAVESGEIHARLEKLGKIPLAKGADARVLYWLGERNEPAPEPTFDYRPGPDANESLSRLRLVTLRQINNQVRAFQTFAARCNSIAELKTAMRDYHISILHSLSLRVSGDDERLGAAVLLILEDGTLEFILEPTDAALRLGLPTMRLDMNNLEAEPQAPCGVAAYAAWGSQQLGVAYAPDVRDKEEGNDIVFCTPDEQSIGRYKRRRVLNIFKPKSPHSPVPFRALLCVPVSIVQQAFAHADNPPAAFCGAILNISSTIPAGFTDQDFFWADTVAAFLGSMYSVFCQRMVAINGWEADVSQILSDVH